MKVPEELLEIFNKVYGTNTVSVYFAPGRVNLIGEHTDYNGGYVLPCALADLGIFLAIRSNNDNCIRLKSTDYDELIEIPLTQIHQPFPRSSWVS